MAKSRLIQVAVRLTVALAGGLLAGLALPRVSFWPAIFLSVALILWSIRGLKFWSSVGTGLIAGFTFYLSQTLWMSAYLGPIPLVALATLEGIIFAFGMGVTSVIWRYFDKVIPDRNPLKSVVISLAIGFSWIFREWFAGHYPYGGYQWSRLAQSQADTLLAKYAFLGGLSLVSFVVVFIAATLVQLWSAKSKRALLQIALVLVVAFAPALINLEPASGKQVTVAAVQGNANAGLFANPLPGSILSKHLAVTRQLVEDPRFDSVDLVVWPENSSDLDPTNRPDAKSAISSLLENELKRPFVLGAVTFRESQIFNSTLYYEPGAGLVDWYDKKRPVPFGEYVPDREVWNALAPDLIGMISHGYSFGKRDPIFDIGAVGKVGTLVCFEISIDDVLHDLSASGAQVILSQANNADFGKTDETFQQEALARLQAIATGLPIVHVSTVGVTEIIRSDGVVTSSLEPFKPGYLIDEIRLSSGEQTPAMRFFGWVDNLSIALTLLLLATATVSNLRARGRKGVR